MAMSTYLRGKVVGHALCGVPFTLPSTLYLALMTTAPNDGGGGVEVPTTGSAYGRRVTSFVLTPGTATTPTAAISAAAVEFAEATSAWGTITHAAVYDSPTGGNLMFWAPVSVPKNIGNGDVFRQREIKIELL